MMRHMSGAVSIVECTYESRRQPDVFPETLIEIEGSKGAIILKPGSLLEVTTGGQLREEDLDPPVLPWAERPWHIVQESVLATCAHILDALQSGQPADTSAADNMRTFALAEAAYEAAKSRNGMTISPVR